MRIFAIALGTLATIACGLPSNAQTQTGSAQVESWEINSDTKWSFSSDDESSSVRDKLQQLGEYDASRPDSKSDVQLLQENHRWGNQGDVEDFSVQTDVLDY